jgi:hypothetical protein
VALAASATAAQALDVRTAKDAIIRQLEQVSPVVPTADLGVPGDIAPRAAPDGVVTVADVVLCLRYAVGLDGPTSSESRRADVSPPIRQEGQVLATGDQRVSVSDVVLLLRAAVGLDVLTWNPAALAGGGLDDAISALELSLRASDGSSLHVDGSHLVDPPGGTVSFEQARAAALELERVLAEASLPSQYVRQQVDDALERVMELHVYLADVAIQEAAGRSTLAGAPADLTSPSAALTAARDKLADGREAEAMRDLSLAWTTAVTATPPPPPLVGSAPAINVEGPADEAMLLGVAGTAVVGMVNDIVAGTVDGSDVNVRVNGVAALVDNRSYLVLDVPLHVGMNALVAVVRDVDGNVTSAASAVTVLPDGFGPGAPVGTGEGERGSAASHGGPIHCTCGLYYVSGNLQQGPILTMLPQPLVVSVRGVANVPVANIPVIFRVGEGNGSVAAAPAEVGERVIAVPTDAAGLARA